MLQFSAAVASFRNISTCGFYSHIYLIMLSQPKHTEILLLSISESKVSKQEPEGMQMKHKGLTVKALSWRVSQVKVILLNVKITSKYYRFIVILRMVCAFSYS